MSAGLGQLNLDQPAWQVTPAPPVLPATGAERRDAAINAAMAPDRYDLSRESRAKLFDAMAKDYSDLTGKPLGPSPHNPSITMAERRANPNKPIEWYIAEREKSARAKLAAARQSFGDEQIPNDFLNYDSIDAEIAQTSVQARERAAMLEGSGHGATAFFYGMGAAMTAPHNIAGMAFLGSTAVPREAATATLMQWTKSALAEGVYQGAIQTPLTVVGTGLEYSARSTIGTQPHIKEMIEEVATAAAGGFVLGAGTRALHGLLTKLKLAGIELPPDVRDAANVIEWESLYSAKNITDLHASRFEGLMDDAQASVMKGKAPEEPAHGPGEKLGPDVPEYSYLGIGEGQFDSAAPAPTPGAPKTAPSGEAHIDAANKSADDLGSLSQIVQKWIADPDALHVQLDEARETVRVAEGKIAEKYGVSRSKLYSLEDDVTPGESHFLYHSDNLASTEQLNAVAKALEPVDSLADASRALSYELPRLPKDIEKLSFSDELVLMRLQVIKSEVERLGGDFKKSLREALDKHGGRYSDVNDAEFMTEQVLADLKKLHDAGFEMSTKVKNSELAAQAKSLLAESERLQKYVDNPEGAPPIIELPKEGAGRPPETIITPEEVAMVDRAKTIAEASTDHADSLRALKAHDVEQAKIEAMAKRCGIGIP